MNPLVCLEPATPADAGGILAVHGAAVQGTAAGSYARAIIDSWSPPTPRPGAIERLADRLATGAELAVIARERIGRIVGYGGIMPEQAKLIAVYVSPDRGRIGIGGLLVAELEALARRASLRSLALDASLNAEAFYRRCGFSVVNYGEHVLNSGVSMACVHMQKDL